MKESFAKTGRMKIRYLESDAGNGAASASLPFPKRSRRVLFIHGLGSSADRWLDIPDAMSLVGFDSIAIDLPGFGGSDRPADMNYAIKNFVQTVAEFMRKKDMDDGRTSVVGHSLGGYIAAQLAIEHRQFVDKLVLIDSSGMLQGPTPLLREYLAAAMHPSKESVRKVFEELVANPLRIPEILVDGFIYRIRQPNAQRAFRLTYEDSTSTRIGARGLQRLSGIPTLIVWGSEDRLIPVEHCWAFASNIRNSQTAIVKDAGHAPFAEKPAIVCELLHNFLASQVT
jgi:pimeloyl-ACP methyl ester carboxylesterase